MTTRQRVRRRLERIRHRLHRLIVWEKRRDRITKERRAEYLRLRKQYPDNDPRVLKALKRFRRSRRLSQKIDQTEKVLRRRAENKREWLQKHPPPLDPDGDGLIVIDGRQVAKGVGAEVLRIRKAGRWKGGVVSGYRTPAHSIALCEAMCGHPSCPGRCAGAASRHAKKGGRDGAVDVSDFWTFRSECARLGSWLENHLPLDPVHFSDIGN